jgi:hypothetical protein
MSDITKCIDSKCPSRKKCWRYIAPVSPRQSYSDFNRFEDEQACDSFWLVLPDANRKLYAKTKTED